MSAELDITTYPQFLARAAQIGVRGSLINGTGKSFNYYWMRGDFAIILLIDRDGVDLRYLDWRNQPKAFFLSHFLVSKAGNPKPAYPADPQMLTAAARIPIELDFYLTLLEQSPEILSGDRGWQDTYSLSVMPAPKHWFAELWKIKSVAAAESR